MKTILSIFLLLILLATGAGYVAITRIDDIAKQAIETEGPKITGTAVTVDAVSVELGKGALRLTNLAVANPEGFTVPQALVVPDVLIDVRLDTLRDPLVVFEEIALRNPQINFEVGLRGSNLSRLDSHARQSASAPQPQGGEQDQAPSDKRFAVEKLMIKAPQVRVTALGQSTAQKLPDIVAGDLGTDGTGVTMEEVVGAFFTLLVSEIPVEDLGGQMARDGLNILGGALRGGLNDARQGLGQFGERLQQQLDSSETQATVDQVREKADQASQQISETFGGFMSNMKERLAVPADEATDAAEPVPTP